MEKVKECAGLLSRLDIETELQRNELQIIPFEKSNLTDLGYNLTPSGFIFSTQKGILLEIHETAMEKYVWVPSCDTVLILSREYISVSCRLAGTFHSRVRVVSQGFGHVSTTLDPGWRGPLLFALNNPSSQRKKLVLESNNGKGPEHISFITMMLQYLNTPATQTVSDNKAFRLDVLTQYYNASGMFRRRANKSFVLLNSIINMAREMSPDQPNNEVPTEEIDKLQAYLTECLNCYKRGGTLQELRANLTQLDYAFIQLKNNSSKIFLNQYTAVQAALIRPEQEGAEELIFLLECLLGGCEMEKKTVRWEAYSNRLVKRMADYYISKRMRLSMLLRQNWLPYTTITVCGLALSISVFFFTRQSSEENLLIKFLIALIPALCSQIVNFFLARPIKG